MWSASAKRLERIKPHLSKRARLIAALRSFFVARGFLEIETPVRILSPAPEDHINAPPCGRHFLRSSPELHMKRLVAAGYEKIFQIGPCFREGEIGRLHGEEFTMLEWYETSSDYERLLMFVKEMLRQVVQEVDGSTCVTYGGTAIRFDSDWGVLSVDEAFRRFAGCGVAETVKCDEFEVVLVEKVEPSLPRDRPVILKDYPAAMAALARLKPDDHTVAERWELYLGGVEIANAYSELTDPVEQRQRFDAVAEKRGRAGLPAYPIDSEFLAALSSGMPACAGCALGVDRLAMILCGASSIGEVRSFSE